MPRETVTFEQYRLLSEGLTELEVIAIAGEPDREIGMEHWIYHRDDGYIVEVKFSGGRVIRIDEAKGLH